MAFIFKMQTVPENTTSSVDSTKITGRFPVLSIIILLFVVLVFIVGIFLFKDKLKLQTSESKQLPVFLENFKKETSTLDFPSIRWKESLFKYYGNTLAQKDKPKQFKELSGAFDFLLRMYILNPNPTTRKSLEDLKAFLGDNYKELYREKKFFYTCMDTGCNLPIPPSEIADITKRVEKLNSIDSQIKKLTIQSLTRADAFSDKSEKWPQYDSAFQLLKGVYKKEKNNTELKNILEKLATYIQRNFPEESKSLQKTKGEENHYLVD